MRPLTSAAATLAATILVSTAGLGQPNACYNGWSFENVTMTAWQNESGLLTPGGGPGVAGIPAPFSWQQRNVGHRDEIFARDGSGNLVHYYRIGSGPWLSEIVGVSSPSRPRFSTDPVAVWGTQGVQGQSYDRHDVFGVDANDHLIHYWWSEIPPSRWQHENLTAAHGGPDVGGQPVVINSYYAGGLRNDVYSVDASGDLIHYWWAQSWHHENLTQTVGGEQFSPFRSLSVVSAAYNSQPEHHHVFGTSASGHLLEYWHEASGWQWRNVSAPSGFQIHPVIASETDAFDGSRFSVFGFRGTDFVRYWSWSLPTWSSENVTSAFGFGWGSSGAVYGRPTARRSRQDLVPRPTSWNDILMRHDVFARDSNGHLIHYWAADPYQQYTGNNGVLAWRPGENLTQKIDGIWLGTDPLLAIRGARHDPEQYVVARKAVDGLVLYCWKKSDGWSSNGLEAVSSPLGERAGEAPALTERSTVGLSVYAVGINGDLLHFWKP